ncbi:MAG: hypothetical protein MK066_06960 [Crocinitomicaceae bacterium]|nr:hypothetical protein [Crocinitomicaceae bacterium]
MNNLKFFLNLSFSILCFASYSQNDTLKNSMFSGIDIIMDTSNWINLDKRVFIYYTSKAFELDSGKFVGNLIDSRYDQMIVENDSSTEKFRHKDYFGFKINSMFFRVSESKHIPVISIGYKGKFFYQNGLPKLYDIERNELGGQSTSVNFREDYFYSDKKFSQIKNIRKLKFESTSNKELNWLKPCLFEKDTRVGYFIVSKFEPCLRHLRK